MMDSSLTIDGHIVYDGRGKVQSNVIGPLDDRHNVVLLLVLRGLAPTENEEGVGVCVQPRDFVNTAAFALPRP